MADFEVAIKFVLENEGGFVDSPNDPGGATNFGLSLRFLKSLPDENIKRYGLFIPGGTLGWWDIRNLTLDRAKLIYRGEFWEQAPFDKIFEQGEANYILDMCVHHGISQGIKILQRSFWPYCNDGSIIDDGVLGSRTLAIMESVLNYIYTTMAERAGYIRLLCALDPKKKEFLEGWLKRCYRI